MSFFNVAETLELDSILLPSPSTRRFLFFDWPLSAASFKSICGFKPCGVKPCLLIKCRFRPCFHRVWCLQCKHRYTTSPPYPSLANWHPGAAETKLLQFSLMNELHLRRFVRPISFSSLLIKKQKKFQTVPPYPSAKIVGTETASSVFSFIIYF